MAIQLSKGQRIDLTKTNPGLTKAVIGLGWDTNKYSGGHDFDLDASAFLVDAHDNCVNDLDFVFYNNLAWLVRFPNGCDIYFYFCPCRFNRRACGERYCQNLHYGLPKSCIRGADCRDGTKHFRYP